jgi:aryl-alcohol dehydrogenase-like predicted oxidoreductase
MPKNINTFTKTFAKTMEFTNQRNLGSTPLKVGRLGLASSYGAPAEAFEEAFEKGCNYFVWNSFVHGRSAQMRDALRNLIKAGKRDSLVIALHCYGHNAYLNKISVKKSLKLLGTDYIDVMLLGYYGWKPAKSVIDGAKKLQAAGLVRFIGLTGHNRKLIAQLAQTGVLDVYHVRYNAVHTGAETDIFPYLKTDLKPGIVAFTATRWGQLLNPNKMPPGEKPLTASDCYRFALSNPNVDVCLTGPKTREQMQENLRTLELGPLQTDEMERIRRIGEYIYSKK